MPAAVLAASATAAAVLCAVMPTAGAFAPRAQRPPRGAAAVPAALCPAYRPGIRPRCSFPRPGRPQNVRMQDDPEEGGSGDTLFGLPRETVALPLAGLLAAQFVLFVGVGAGETAVFRCWMRWQMQDAAAE